MYVLIGTARDFLSKDYWALFPPPPCEQGLQSLAPQPRVVYTGESGGGQEKVSTASDRFEK